MQLQNSRFQAQICYFFRGTIDEGLYASDEELFDDLITAYQGVIQALYDEGCRYLQIDDTSWAIFFSEEGRKH